MHTIVLSDKELDMVRAAILKDARTLRASINAATSMSELFQIEDEAALRELLESRLAHA